MVTFPKQVWTPLTFEDRVHAEVKPGDRILESWGVCRVAEKTETPDGRVAYRYEGDQPVVSYHPANGVTVVTAGGYAPA